MPLTELQIRKAKPQPGKLSRLYDAGGLYLEISKSGGKWWRLKYRFNKKEKLISLGIYPETSLPEARDHRDEARKLLRDGIDPSQKRKAEKLASTERSENTFGKVAREWYAKNSEVWVPLYAERVLSRMNRDLLPFLDERPIDEIEAPELLAVLRRIEDRGVREVVHRTRQDCGQIFAFAIAAGKCKHNPAAGLGKALAPRRKVVHFPAVTEPKELGELLRTLYGYQGTATVRAALRLAPLVVTRPGELRKAKWTDVDLDGAEWRFVASKTQPGHIVPLSKQALRILRELHQITGSGEYVFPGARSAKRPMSDNAVLAAMRRMEIPVDVATGHGFRASFRTIGAEVLKFPADLLDHQLAHEVKDPNGRAYNRTAFLKDRRRMMQKWSDYLDQLKDGKTPKVVVGNFQIEQTAATQAHAGVAV
jgi:integrase